MHKSDPVIHQIKEVKEWCFSLTAYDVCCDELGLIYRVEIIPSNIYKLEMDWRFLRGGMRLSANQGGYFGLRSVTHMFVSQALIDFFAKLRFTYQLPYQQKVFQGWNEGGAERRILN